ncbi:MAG: outer membrane protein assembly factor BamE [Phycisphaerales bacterium]|nr:MAG: outer membrane protein assembly factor BamE [Phycisphaerales bacterium]
MWSAVRNWGKLAGLFLALAPAMAGCIACDSEVTYGDKGPAVGRSTLRQVKPGRTTKQWVLATLGEPTSQDTIPDGQEILRYEYVKRTKSDFAMVPPPLAFENEREQHTRVVFEIRDGVVVDYWKEY